MCLALIQFSCCSAICGIGSWLDFAERSFTFFLFCNYVEYLILTDARASSRENISKPISNQLIPFTDTSPNENHRKACYKVGSEKKIERKIDRGAEREREKTRKKQVESN